MKSYKILWKTIKHAESYIMKAKNKKEAKEKALDDLDYDFKEIDEDWFWKVERMVEVDKDFNEI